MGYYIYFFRGIFSLSLRARYFLCADKESTQRKLPRACQAFVAYWLYSGALSHSASLPHGPGSASCLAPLGATCVQPNAPHGNRKGCYPLSEYGVTSCLFQYLVSARGFHPHVRVRGGKAFLEKYIQARDMDVAPGFAEPGRRIKTGPGKKGFVTHACTSTGGVSLPTFLSVQESRSPKRRSRGRKHFFVCTKTNSPGANWDARSAPAGQKPGKAFVRVPHLSCAAAGEKN